jgi:stearoyl-CoA desaturase (delta-9 desaturase)
LLSGQGSPILAASIHRHHHLYSDTERDVHSIRDSLFNVFFFSLKGSAYFVKEKRVKFSNELLKDKTLRFIHKYYAKLWALIIFVFALINFKFLVFVILATIGWNAVYTNFCRTFLAHTKIPGSYRTFDTSDNSYNNMFLQIICLGEGLHNNHHMYPTRLDQAVLLSEFDPAAFVIEKFLADK